MYFHVYDSPIFVKGGYFNIQIIRNLWGFIFYKNTFVCLSLSFIRENGKIYFYLYASALFNTKIFTHWPTLRSDLFVYRFGPDALHMCVHIRTRCTGCFTFSRLYNGLAVQICPWKKSFQ